MSTHDILGLGRSMMQCARRRALTHGTPLDNQPAPSSIDSFHFPTHPTDDEGLDRARGPDGPRLGRRAKMPSASPTVNTASIAYKFCGTFGDFIKIPTPSAMDSTALQAAVS